MIELHWIYAHLIGDYILQNDWMALNKKKNFWAGLAHCLVYILPFMFCGFSSFQLFLIFAQHLLIDTTNFVVWFMKIKGSGKFATGPCSPWSVIAVDNILHILWMALVAKLGIYL